MSIADKIKTMSLEEKAGQLVMSSFVGRWDVPEQTIRLLEEGAIGSILYFSGCNVVDSLQLRSLTEKVQAAARRSRTGIPQFIAIDQEGGQLAPITQKISVGPGNMALAAIAEKGEDYAYSIGKITGEELAVIGITACFAPVVDLCHDEGLPIKDNRYFGSDPVKAAKLAAAFTKGLQDAGVMACAKHFPGQRNVDIDSHFELDTVPHTFDRLMSREWIPFCASIDAGVSMMMTLHASFPELDPSGTPATLSKPILGDVLRGKLNFKGLIISDDIQMKPIRDKYGIDGALVKAVAAGVDIIIVSGGVDDANKIIADGVRKGLLSEERLNEACAHVLAFKEKYVPASIPDEKKASSVLVSAENTRKVQEAADKSITILRNTAGVIPPAGKKLELPTNSRVAILRPTYGRLMMSDNTNFYPHTFKEVFSAYFPNVFEYVYGMDPSDVEILGATDWAFMADYVIICTYNAYQHEQQMKLLAACKPYTVGKKLAVVALRSPADLPIIPADVETLVATYGVAECSVRALARVLAGVTTAGGKLPVGGGDVNKIITVRK